MKDRNRLCQCRLIFQLGIGFLGGLLFGGGSVVALLVFALVANAPLPTPKRDETNMKKVIVLYLLGTFTFVAVLRSITFYDHYYLTGRRRITKRDWQK